MPSLKNIILMGSAFLLMAAKPSESLTPSHSSTPIALPLTRVVDGDTFVAGNITVRLWGIDAPEKEDNHFLASKLYLSILLERAPFSCHFKSKDKYKRYIMVCYSLDEDIASLLVRQGLATDYSQYSGGAYREDENFARGKRHGIWNRKKAPEEKNSSNR
jgi:endonuclease YncB( thermonuclease family)